MGGEKGARTLGQIRINEVMVLRWDRKDYPPGKGKVFLTNLAISRPMKIIDQ